MIKKIIKSITTPQQRIKIERSIMYILSRKKKINISSKFRCIKHKNADTFFGYYDINPFSDNSIVYLVVKNNECLIMLNRNGIEENIGKTSAWCWQQGCRLRWCPNDNDAILWNNFDGEKYYSVEYRVSTRTINRKPYAFYDISADGNYGATLDFNRLGYMRPGYGYTNKSFDPVDEVDGIAVIDMKSFSIVKNLTYDLLMKYIPEQLQYNDCYFNHLSFSPNSQRILFFFLTKGTIHKARLFVYDITKDRIIPLELNLSVSHYCWLDDENILATAYDEKRNCRYYIYNVNNRKRISFLHEKLTVDGHPVVIDEDHILTDTYPNSSGFQKLLLIDRSNSSISVIAELYSTARFLGEKRTDLHPRYDSCTGLICVDTNSYGKRQIIIIER